MTKSYRIKANPGTDKNIRVQINQDFDLIENGIYPELYYSQDIDSVFSKWSVKVSLRVAILFLLLSIMSIIPWNKVIKQESSN
jgi:hypothetical protein